MHGQCVGMQISSTPGQTFRIVREARGWSPRDVALNASIDAGHLSRVERGEKGLSVASMYSLATVLDLEELARVLAPHIEDRGREK
jgi:transcriptional regulator with XRE-family HTH domain